MSCLTNIGAALSEAWRGVTSCCRRDDAADDTDESHNNQFLGQNNLTSDLSPPATPANSPTRAGEPSKTDTQKTLQEHEHEDDWVNVDLNQDEVGRKKGE